MKYLSVVVPSYNIEDFLTTCLDSFADERLRESVDVMIVNDGSTDRTAEIAQTYVDRMPELFRLINKENGGHGSAVNAGIRHATGKYFRIVDGDDWMETDNLVKLVEILKTSEADMVVDQKTRVEMGSGATHFIALPDSVDYSRVYALSDMYGEDICHFYSLHTVNIRLDILKEHQVQILEKAFYVDNEYLLKAVAYSRTVQFVNLDIYRYLIGNASQSVSHTSYAKRYDQHERVIKECLRFAQQGGWDAALYAYMRRRIMPLIETHHVIALIYETDRRAGAAKAKAFFAFMQEHYPAYAAAKRYHACRLLHFLGVHDAGLERMKALTGRKKW